MPTAFGPGRLLIERPRPGASNPSGAVLLLGHGAGGDVDAVDLLAVRAAALTAGLAVARFTQPYRVAGRRAPAPAAQLDAAWLAAVALLRRRRGTAGRPLVVGGRSSGARVACRTANAAGAAGVVALAFPTHPPGRPERSRVDELSAPDVPVLVVQGERDAFGRPPEPRPGRLVIIPGADHGLKKGLDVVSAAVVEFAAELTGQRA